MEIVDTIYLVAYFNPDNPLHEEANFGHHLAMVYGDYVQDLKDLGEIMKFKVIEV